MDFNVEGVAALLAVAVSVAIYTSTQVAQGRVRQAELVRGYTNDFYGSAAVTGLFMDIDHEKFAYDDAVLGTDRELALIRLLDFFNAVGHSWRRGVLRLDDILPTTIGYAALRTWENEHVRCYLRQIRVWDEERYSTAQGFRYFEELAIAIAKHTGRLVADDPESLVISATARRRRRFPSVRLPKKRPAERVGASDDRGPGPSPTDV